MAGIWYEASDAAADERPPVLLVHSFAMSAERDWAELRPRLLASGRRVLAVDLPGHGHAAPTAPPQARPSAIAAELATLIEAQGRPVDVVGYSLGARLCWELPAVTTRIRRLVIGGLAPFEPFATLDIDAVRAAIAGAPPADPMIGMIAQMLTLPGNDPESLLACIEGLRGEPFAPDAVFETPTLLVIGDQDPMAAGSAPLAQRLPHAELTQIPGDHVAALHGPAFGDTVLRFLDAG
jgi:pimeloyl-ACP methyl ester carboxylesterase